MELSWVTIVVGTPNKNAYSEDMPKKDRFDVGFEALAMVAQTIAKAERSSCVIDFPLCICGVAP
jgi:hypothetical protein